MKYPFNELMWCWKTQLHYAIVFHIYSTLHQNHLPTLTKPPEPRGWTEAPWTCWPIWGTAVIKHGASARSWQRPMLPTALLLYRGQCSFMTHAHAGALWLTLGYYDNKRVVSVTFLWRTEAPLGRAHHISSRKRVHMRWLSNSMQVDGRGFLMTSLLFWTLWL